jgi:outer membrane protein insertion porin family
MIQKTLRALSRVTTVALLVATATVGGFASTPPSSQAASNPKQPDTLGHASASSAILRSRDLRGWYGLQVSEIKFEGITSRDITTLQRNLALQPGDKLSEENIKSSLHQLYATGLYRNIVAVGYRSGGHITVAFRGVPQMFLRRMYVHGMKQELLAAQIERATRLEVGQPFTAKELDQATVQLKRALALNGFFEPQVSVQTISAGSNHLVDVVYTVTIGKQARVGAVTVAGDTGMSLPKFRKVGKLKEDSRVTSNTVSRALDRLRKDYQKNNRLEATVRATSKTFNPSDAAVDYSFEIDRGPAVRVIARGAKVSSGELKRLIPVYEEGAVDPDLLDEGDVNLRNHFQKKGFFDAKVTHVLHRPTPNQDTIVYTIREGAIHKVISVKITGNHYFDIDTLKEHLSVQKADALNRHGLFSQALLADDIASLSALYKNNGFGNIRVDPVVTDSDKTPGGRRGKLAYVRVVYIIHEGVQQRIGKVQLIGVRQVSPAKLLELMNTRPGEPYSLTSLAGDRIELYNYYYEKGFSQANLSFEQHPQQDDPNLIDVDVRIHEGDPFYVNQVLLSGLHYTRPQVVDKLLELHPGDPLNRNALLDTQRRLYNLALFNEVQTGIVNPKGTQQSKDILLNLSEAHRWNYDYGFGFEVQTGTPQRNCPSAASLIQIGIDPATFKCSPNGKFGASPRISFDISRINIRGRNQTVTLQTAYGTLEQQAIMTFDDPAFYGHKTIDFALSGGYVSAQDITTYEASTISGSALFTERPNKANTLIYSMAYRYVYVNPNSLQISADLIPLLSQPTRVSGPGITWVHDTRNNPLNATTGWYLSEQQFFAWSGFASQANFNRIDVQESNYHLLNKQNWVLARSTRIAFENTYGDPKYNLIPLPERLYAGGATSHRGFSVNSAGPRDLQTGYPVGGSGAFINSLELRIPPVPLPLLGNNVGFALFDDTGNVYTDASSIFPSLVRFHQPNVKTCYNTSGKQGVCNFDYDSNAVGSGIRYKTPVGPIRLDFSYNLNPTVYPVILSYSGQPPYVGNSGHFNFFFSIGQAF